MGVPCVSSAQMKTHSLPVAFIARAKTSVCTDSTRCPRWSLPFAYGRAWVTSIREVISTAFYSRMSPRAHLDQQALQRQPRIGAVLQLEVHLSAAHQRLAPECARPSPRPLVAQPRGERMRDLLLLRGELFLEGRKQLGLVLVVAQLALPGAGVTRAVGQGLADGARHSAQERERHRRGVRLPAQLVAEELKGLGGVPLSHRFRQ